jgi:hypothetical protein
LIMSMVWKNVYGRGTWGEGDDPHNSDGEAI